ncbi:unnamed protein product [Candidula unifasciata]|uniref:Serpin domain-containing protein n=1 Tax=Candidula unifasciata TaxID=100452 RepID=A0A8S3ZWZ1_9EUPU|nr:unnamed protein product [Candidula unifasciata]
MSVHVPAGNLYISEVIHKAVIEAIVGVMESGTVASAVTTIEVEMDTTPEEMFKADHPFVFFLRDNHSQQILFQGKFSG